MRSLRWWNGKGLYCLFMVVPLLLCHVIAFSDTFYFDVKENSKPQTFVGKISTKAGFTYRFNDDPVEFELDPETGVIVTTDVPTDRESKSVYNLVILSSSPTYPLEVKIRILDVNDNVPFWPSYINTNISFSESAPIGTKVIVDNAIDLDGGDLEYRLDYVSDTLNNGIDSQLDVLPFKLNYNSSTSFLHLEVAYKLDREIQSNYLINITALDGDRQSSSELFNIRVLDSNDNPPIFDHSDYSVSLNESMGKDVSILQVRATDADEENNDNSRISYYLTSEDFKIDPNSGVISTSHDGPIICGTTTTKTENESWRVCVFTVFAHDYGVPRQDGRTYVTAKIYDSNNHAPTIKFRYFSKSDFANVDESAINGSVVAAVSVVDSDQGPNGQTWLEITNGNELGHFRLESIGNSHIIRVNQMLDRENVPQYNLTVVVHDRGTPSRSSTSSLFILVQDHNDHEPKFDQDVYETVISENENQIGVFVYTVQATDLDDGINSQIYYSLSGANSHFFKIDSTSGMITTEKFINREEIDFFELRISARDGGSNPKWAHTLLKIKVLDLNDDTPKIELLPKYEFNSKELQYEVQLEEGMFLDLNLILKDNDLSENGTVDVEILFDYNGLFKFDPESIKLVSTRKLDYEQCASYKIVLLAKDRAPNSQQLSSLTVIQLRVKDIDDLLPMFQQSKYYSFVSIYGFNIIDHSKAVAKLLVKDSDLVTPVTFEIRSKDDIARQLFSVNNEGEINFKYNVNTNLLKDLPNLLSFDIECLGCKPNFNLSQVNIFLLDSSYQNDGQQVSSVEYNFAVEETLPVGSVVGEIDVDIEQYQLYIVEGNLNNAFLLSANRVLTNQPLDRENINHYKILIIAKGLTTLRNIHVHIDLIDVNDCDPYFPVPFEQITINEDVPPMYTVFRLNAFDQDQTQNQSNFRYELLDNPYEMFSITGNELKLEKTFKEVINTNKPINTKMLKVVIKVVDKIVIPSSQVGFKLNDDDRCHSSSEMILFVQFNQTISLKPRFMRKFYEIFISESTPINEQVFKLQVRNSDYHHSFTYSIVSGDSNSFGVLPNGYLYTRRRLDRENTDVYLLNVILRDTKVYAKNASITAIDSCQVLIHVKDVNDNKPVFSSKMYRFSVPENVSSNFFIGQVSATDKDIGSNSQILYSIVNSYYSSFVEIDPYSGFIWSNSEYDRESLPFFEFVVQATDQPIDEDRFSAQVTVRVDILDINDNKPIFEVPSNVSLVSSSQEELSGEIIVSEATEVNSVLAIFKAVDADFESNITYNLHDIENANITYLDFLSGTLLLTKKLDREEKSSYKLLIEAGDGKYTSSFELKLIVEDVDDCEPVWVNLTQTELFVPEDISIGSDIMTLHAIDRDLGSNGLFHFAIENYSGNQKVFDILNQKLVVVSHLDYETSKVHHLNISLIESNSGRIASTKSIKVNLIDVNDCKPIFIQRSETEVVRILENIDIGTKLLTLQASDCDQNDVLSYEIVSCNTHYHTHKNIYQKDRELQHKHDSNNCPLKLNTKTGEIINLNNLDREVIESINLKLSVKDSAGHIDQMKVIFIIDDVNDENPMFVSPKKIVVASEWSKANTIIGSVKAIDLDQGVNSAITYKLDSLQYSDFLELDRYLGVFKTKRSLEELLYTEFNVNVTAIDGGGLSTSDTIQFIAKPNLPYLESISVKIDIYENEPIGTEVTRLKCPTRHDRAISCRFHLINATDRNFDVDSFTGAITTVDLIDREMLEKRLLEVLVISQYNLQKVQVNINILDQNDNPPYLTNTSIVVHLKESLTEESEVFDLSQLVADEDINNKFDFQIINCSTCNGMFNLNRKTGILTLNSQLDSEKTRKYRILFGVSDGIYLLTSIMEIIVDDENDNKPYFKEPFYVFHMDENIERGTMVGQVVAFDDDISNKNLLYSVVHDDASDVFLNAFSLDSRSGQFTLTKRLDYETDPNEYTFYVQASDGKYQSSPVKVVFRLINLPDNPPMFENTVYKLEVVENKILPDILCLKAVDADLKVIEDKNIEELVDKETNDQIHNLTYSINFGHQRSLRDSFTIDQLNGCISIVKPLDREDVSNIDITVMVDDGYFNASALVNVKVLDENDNYPVFSKKTPTLLKIKENIPIDSVVYTFSATDQDEPPNSYVKYEIVGVDNSNLSLNEIPFFVGPIDGQLKVTGIVDREQIERYDLIIRAKDYGLKFSDFSFRIEIEDVIDNSPVFENPYYEVDVYENITIGERVFQLSTQDLDQTDQISYKIISGDILGHFTIEDDYIVVAMSLNFEETNMYNLKINAIDKGGNLDTANINVKVINVPDEKPIFADSPYVSTWFENQLGMVGKFEAVPADSVAYNSQSPPSYNHISYLLLNNYEDSFRLNSSNAALNVIKPIDRELLIKSNMEGIIELKIIAIDSRSRLSGEGVIFVRIVDDNDNKPYFQKEMYLFEMNENQFYDANFTVGFVSAIDLDQESILQYELRSDYEDKFSIDSEGRIFINSSLIFDREKQEVFYMEVYVSDYKHVATTQVKVTIIDSNDCVPTVTKINNIVLTKHHFNSNNEFKLTWPIQKLNSILSKKFPLVGLQITDSDSGVNGQIQVRMNDDELYNFFKIDEKTAVIKSDFKNINLFQESISKISTIDITINDLSDMNQLSSVYSIKLDTTSADLYEEKNLVTEDFVELFISELTEINKTLYKFELSQPISQINIYAGDVYNRFAVIENSLVLLRPLDYEQIRSYDLYLQAINHQKDTEEFQYIFVRVNVNNENDNPPVFLYDVYNATILEEEDRVFVTQVMANDLDYPNIKIKYRLINAENLPFEIEESTGNIWTTSKIDREVNSMFTLTVSAEDEDGLSSTCSIVVQIEDKNDNPPRFTRLFRTNITENTPIGTLVIQITSIDKDYGNNSKVTYKLLTQSDYFKIDPQSGNVYVTGNLDREEKEEYFLTVSADDGSWKSQTTLTIYILDENDVTPRFEKQNYEFNVEVPSEELNKPNMTVGHVRAFDQDRGNNGIIRYKLKNKSKYFSIDSHTGEIFMKKVPQLFSPELDFLNHHQITIIAADKGLLPKTSEAKLIIRCHRSGAQFSNQISIELPVNLKNDTLLYTFNSMITLTDYDEDFVIIRYNQIVFKGESLVRLNRTYRFTIDNRINKFVLHLIIIESNNYAPVFVNDFNSTTILESLYGSHLITEFHAMDQDNTVFNNEVKYSFNVTKIYWHSNADNYLNWNYKDKYPNLFKNGLTSFEIMQNIPELMPLLNPFKINELDGKFYLAHSLDFELITRYTLSIMATDNAWYPLKTDFNFDVLIGDVDDFIDYNLVDSNLLHHASTKPDPMSIGVVLVISFFIILILVISTSFILYHNQRKSHLPQRKIVTNTLSPYLSSNAAMSNQIVSSSRFQNQIQTAVSRPQPFNASSIRCPPLPSQQAQPQQYPQPVQSTSHVQQSHVQQNIIRMNSLCKQPYRQEIPALNPGVGHSSSPNQMVRKQPDIVTAPAPPPPPPISSSHSVASALIESRMQLPTGPSSVYTHTNSENYTDNYSNILASAEHYDLENASSIAPSDIDIVYHYKGFRNRDTLLQNQKHAPLSRLSPSVSELSSAPRILTLQDLSPQVPPCLPIMNRIHKSVNSMAINSVNGQDDDVAVTENSFTCSEFENYDLCKKDKFARVW